MYISRYLDDLELKMIPESEQYESALLEQI